MDKGSSARLAWHHCGEEAPPPITCRTRYPLTFTWTTHTLGRITVAKPSKLRVVVIKPSKYNPKGLLERFWKGFMTNSTIYYIASLTPPEVAGVPVEVHTVDEYVEPNLRYLELLQKPGGDVQNLVALVGVQSHQLHRALDLAAYAVEHGSHAIIGGPHAMTCDTAMLQGNGISFALAEAELILPTILEDALHG